jgi:hypothetical protein
VQFSEFGEEQRSSTPDGSEDSEELRNEGEDERSRLVGITFAWPYSGTSVLVTGSFFNWRNTIALHRRGPEPDPSTTPTITTTTTTTTAIASIPPIYLSTPPLSPTSSAPSTPTSASAPSTPNLVPTSLLATAAALSPKLTYSDLPPSPFQAFQPSLSLSRDFRERDFNNNQPGATGAMCEPEDVFSTVLYLPPGKYEYKVFIPSLLSLSFHSSARSVLIIVFQFIVDGAWHYDPHQPVVVC